MRRPLVFAVIAFLAGPALAFQAVEPFRAKGAESLIIVPNGWEAGVNGLFIYAHGYTADAGTIVPYMRITGVPESFLATDLFFASVGIGEVFHRRTGRKHPWGNMGVEYAPAALSEEERSALNAGIPRAREDADAVRYLRRFYEPRGRTDSKVLTLHALDDGLVIPENEQKYRQAFLAAGTDDQLVQLYTPTGGHCGFGGAEHLAAFLSLTGWVERGDVPTATSARRTASPSRRSPAAPAGSPPRPPARGACASSSAGRRAPRCAPSSAAAIPATAPRTRPARRVSG